MYIPNDYELVKLAIAIQKLEEFINKMLEDTNYTTEEDCVLATNIISANSKLLTTLGYFNMRKGIK